MRYRNSADEAAAIEDAEDPFIPLLLIDSEVADKFENVRRHYESIRDQIPEDAWPHRAFGEGD